MSVDLNNPKTVLQLSEAQRLILIGYSVSKDEFGASPKGEQEYEKEGKLWVNKILPNLKSKICENERVIELRKAVTGNNEVELCLVIADIIVGLIGLAVPPFVVSAQIIKTGLKNICDDQN